MADELDRRGLLLAGSAGAFGLYSWAAADAAAVPAKKKRLKLRRRAGTRPKNILVVLTDDHRYDAIGFMKAQSFGETPTLDRLAREGVHFRNAFVTTALCSPSRATIFTGLYAHQHRVVDNNHPIPAGLIYYPEYLQQAGYETAFIGKWHMGQETDQPQPGFDHWVSFKGQGTYLPGEDGLNVNGRKVPQRGYITDELTDYAMDWIGKRDGKRPWMMHLAHKAVHSEFIPAERHAGRYSGEAFRYPDTMKPDVPGRPMWVENQRNSWHGVDYAYHGKLDIADYYKRYMETLLAVDEGLARIMDLLERRGDLDDTLILYMGDNGFMFGEHGLIDKRAAYEESMRVPMLMRCPSLFGPRTVEDIVANLDVAPTMLAAAGLEAPDGLAGMDMLPLAQGRAVPWRKDLVYEYYWERNFPQTPTVHALREDRYKYIHFHGIWDVDELYDLAADPQESANLLARPGHEQLAERMSAKLFRMLEETGGMQIPLSPDAGERNELRDPKGSPAAPFPPRFYRPSGR
ncbi:sulfatase [Sphingobium fuliginis]|jgi:N-acetylglucosamine-6-sulfatase|uniref:Sulfatase n=1 Tax=Sphingobium fuliginis (strain ATCC 27551) TaxID=336203 RepID=A0A7M2GNI9_SPHSA|nr:sulfatase [Sphingobium fuliginis]QOT74108.1 sulfatase [Sphingobium fuliginis]